MRGNFEKVLDFVLASEGGYVNDPNDNGGPTNMGITIATARRHGVDVDGDGDTDIVDMKALRRQDAAKIYRAEFWNGISGDLLPAGVDLCVMDFGVNSGPVRSIRYLQQALNVEVDGKIGRKTLLAAMRVDAALLIGQLCDRRLEYLKSLKNDWPHFGKGWTARIKKVRAAALKMAEAAPFSTPDSWASAPDSWTSEPAPPPVAPSAPPAATPAPPDVEPVTSRPPAPTVPAWARIALGALVVAAIVVAIFARGH